MTRKRNLFVAVLAIIAMSSMSALAQNKPPSLDEAINQIKSGLAYAGTRVVWNAPEGRIEETRRYQLISTDRCSMQIQMEVESSQGGRTSFSKYINTIPLSELDVSEIKARTNQTSSPDPVFIMSLNSSEDSGREAVNVKLPIRGGRKAISYVVERNYDWTSRISQSQGQQSFFLISFKDKKMAEQVALAFVEVSRLCEAKEEIKR